MKKLAGKPKPINWDLVVKIVGLIALLASGVWALIKLREDRRVDLEHRDQELNRFVFEKQAALYFEAARSAATIARTQDPVARKEATERFQDLYFGELVVVEDRRVELAMISFESCIKSNNERCARSISNQDGKSLDPDVLIGKYGPPIPTNLSLELSACIRSAFQQDRHISFGNATNAQTTCPYD